MFCTGQKKNGYPADFALQPALNVVFTLLKTGEQEECHIFDSKIIQLVELRRSRTAICSITSKKFVTYSSYSMHLS